MGHKDKWQYESALRTVSADPTLAPELRWSFGVGLHWDEMAVSLYASVCDLPQEGLILEQVTPCSCSNS